MQGGLTTNVPAGAHDRSAVFVRQNELGSMAVGQAWRLGNGGGDSDNDRLTTIEKERGAQPAYLRVRRVVENLDDLVKQADIECPAEVKQLCMCRLHVSNACVRSIKGRRLKQPFKHFFD